MTAPTQAEVDALRKAYYSGVLTVRYDTGRMATYQDSESLWLALQRAEEALAGANSNPASVRTSYNRR